MKATTHNSKLKILLWAPFGAGTHYWGPGTSAFRMYKALPKESNVEITLLHSSKEQGFFPDVYDEQIYIDGLRKNSVVGLASFLWRSKKWISKNYMNYDIFHGLSSYEYTFGPALLFSKHGVKTFIKITGSRGGFGNSGFLSRILGISKRRKNKANRISAYISLSDEIKQNLLAYNIHESKIIHIPNGVDTERFSGLKEASEKISIRKQLGFQDKFTLLYVGGLTTNKRVIEQALAVVELIKEGLDIQFIILGPDRSGGIVQNELLKIIGSNKLENSIYLIGTTVKPEVFYKASDLFLLTSRKEGMSNSLLEAMASQLPSVVTPVSGTNALIDDGYNGVYTSGEVEDIKEKIRKLFFNKEVARKIGKAARATVCAKYNYQYVLERHLNLFMK